jgi:hypothetical protein
MKASTYKVNIKARKRKIKEWEDEIAAIERRIAQTRAIIETEKQRLKECQQSR